MNILVLLLPLALSSLPAHSRAEATPHELVAALLGKRELSELTLSLEEDAPSCPGERVQLSATSTDLAGRSRDSSQLGLWAMLKTTTSSEAVTTKGSFRIPNDPKATWEAPTQRELMPVDRPMSGNSWRSRFTTPANPRSTTTANPACGARTERTAETATSRSPTEVTVAMALTVASGPAPALKVQIALAQHPQTGETLLQVHVLADTGEESWHALALTNSSLIISNRGGTAGDGGRGGAGGAGHSTKGQGGDGGDGGDTGKSGPGGHIEVWVSPEAEPYLELVEFDNYSGGAAAEGARGGGGKGMADPGKAGKSGGETPPGTPGPEPVIRTTDLGPLW
ncbi:MAG: hypothetical protein ACI9VR_001683 [Cognaticolwellia sp.]|jgi:hypothetical protein